MNDKPAHLVRFRKKLTAEQVEAFRLQFEATLKTQGAVIYDVPWRARFRWMIRNRIDAIGIWLCDRNPPEAAMAHWRACRMW